MSPNRGWVHINIENMPSKSWLRPHLLEIMRPAWTSALNTPSDWALHDLQPLSAQIKLRSSAMVIIPHRTVQFFPPSQFGSSPSDPRIRSPRSAHLDDNFLARPYSALSSTRQTLCTAPDQQRYLKTPSLLVNIPIYFSWPKYDTPPTAMVSKKAHWQHRLHLWWQNLYYPNLRHPWLI